MRFGRVCEGAGEMNCGSGRMHERCGVSQMHEGTRNYAIGTSQMCGRRDEG